MVAPINTECLNGLWQNDTRLGQSPELPQKYREEVKGPSARFASFQIAPWSHVQ